MARIERFEDLEIWQLARSIANEVYDQSDKGAFGKDFVPRDQVRRAVVSIFSNIAEGFERNGNREFLQFLSVAKASCGEVKAQLIFAKDREYISDAEFEATIVRVNSLAKQIGGFSKYLRKTEIQGIKFDRNSKS